MSPKTILFLGATGGVALSALRRSLAANHTCICLVRTPSKLTNLLSLGPEPPTLPPNLHIITGNAHSVSSLVSALTSSPNPSSLPDIIISSIGGAFDFKSFGIDDPHVCERGIEALLQAIKEVRGNGVTGNPQIVVVSTTGVSESGVRDVPLLMVPLYHVMLKEAHKDKKLLEKNVQEGGERFTIVRPSMLTDGAEGGKVRAGVEDVKDRRVESQAVGYTISRADAGRWIFEEVVEGDGARWEGKAVTISY